MNDITDIVSRLRRTDENRGVAICSEAADTIEQLRKERDAALAVVDEFISDTTTNNETPTHECEFVTDPEKGKCDACEAWGNYVGLFCSSEEEETL